MRNIAKKVIVWEIMHHSSAAVKYYFSNNNRFRPRWDSSAAVVCKRKQMIKSREIRMYFFLTSIL